MGIPIKFEQRIDSPKWLILAGPVASLIAALLVGSIFLLATGHPPLDTFNSLLRGSFTTHRGFTNTLGLATILICTGLAAGFAFQMNLYNIGGEGQLYLGMIGGAWAGIALGDHFPGYLAVLLTLLFGALAGGLWVTVPAITKARFGTSEIVSTLLLNYVALNLVNYFIFGSKGFFRDPSTAFPQGRKVPDSVRLDAFGKTQTYPTIFLSVLLAVFLFWLIKKSEFGYRIKVLADSPKAAGYAGINAPRLTLSVLVISGALAGLGGAMLVVGPTGKLDPGVAGIGLGYAGIVVAALARYNFVAIILASVLFAGLRVGGDSLQISTDVPIHIAVIIQGAVLIFALGGEVFRKYRIRIVRPASAAGVTA